MYRHASGREPSRSVNSYTAHLAARLGWTGCPDSGTGSTAPHTPDGAVELLVGLSQQYGGIDSYGDGLLILREDVRDPILRRRGSAWESELTAALEARFSSVPDAPAGIGYALAAHWQGSLTWWAFRADRSLHDYLTDKLNEFISMLVDP